MDLTLIIKDSCSACLRVEKAIKNLAILRKEILLTIINIKDLTHPKTQICPALYINQELYTYGDINEKELLAYLIQQYKMGACEKVISKSN